MRAGTKRRHRSPGSYPGVELLATGSCWEGPSHSLGRPPRHHVMWVGLRTESIPQPLVRMGVVEEGCELALHSSRSDTK